MRIVLRSVVFRAVLLVVLPCFPMFAATETVAEFTLEADTVINVAEGDVKRIEYLSGTAAVTLTKTGPGTLEVAVVGNTNAVFDVDAGKLKFVRPGRLALSADEVAFHVDGSDTASYTVQSTENGTNFVKTIVDADGRDFCATNTRAGYYPWILPDALNGLSVFDFGSSYGQGLTTGRTGVGMAWEKPILANEIFYIWMDREDSADINDGGYGPTPLCLLSQGYRGTNQIGRAGWNLFRTSKNMTDNLYVDDMKSANATVPDKGWHLLRTFTSKEFTVDNWSVNGKVSYAAIAFGYRRTDVTKSVNTPYGGMRLAEVVVCSNYLSSAKRDYVNLYLKRKWFGGYPVKSINIAAGASLDATEAPVYVTWLQTDGAAVVEGIGNLRVTATSSGAADNVPVSSGVYTAPDRSVATIPNLGFSTDGEVFVGAGATNAINKTDGRGTFVKSGPGMLWVAHLEAGFTGVSAKDGTLVVNPLLTPAGALHVAADDSDAFTFESENGTNFVIRWEDVSRNGQALVVSDKHFIYDEEKLVNKPFFTEDAQNGLPAVDFGTMNDSEHQYGWGGTLDVLKRIRSSGDAVTPDECGARQTFIVWKDDDEAIDRPWVTDPEDGTLKPFVGPSLYGSSGFSWRAPCANGEGFAYMRTAPGSNSFREGLRLDAEDVGVTEVGEVVPGRGYHLADHRIGESLKTTAIDIVGGNETCRSSNGPYQERGVFGGVSIGEFMAFRYHLPDAQRSRIESALGVKWFGGDLYSLEYGFDSVAVTNGATLAFPYADVTVGSLDMAEGAVSARSVTATTLDLIEDSVCEAPLTLSDAGTIILHGSSSDGLSCISATSVSLGSCGNIDVSGIDVASMGARSFRIMATSSVTGTGARWKGRGADGIICARLKVCADGVYVKFGAGFHIMVR